MLEQISNKKNHKIDRVYNVDNVDIDDVDDESCINFFHYDSYVVFCIRNWIEMKLKKKLKIKSINQSINEKQVKDKQSKS